MPENNVVQVDRIARVDWTLLPENELAATIRTGVQIMETEMARDKARIRELEDFLAGVSQNIPTEAALLIIVNDPAASDTDREAALADLYKLRHPRMLPGRCIRDQRRRTYKLTGYEWRPEVQEFQIYGERWDDYDGEFTGYKSIIEWARPVPDPEAG